MKFAQEICVVALILQVASPPVRAQGTSVSPSQSSSADAGQEKQRSAGETRDRLRQLACGPSGVGFSHHTEKVPQTLPEQPPEKGLIYVIRLRHGGLQTKLGMDGKWVGTNRGANYFYIEADPGSHYFCSKTGLNTPALLSLVIEKEKTYYLYQNITMGGEELSLLDEPKGKEYLAKSHRSLFELKTKNSDR
jgi:hypothetical protein